VAKYKHLLLLPRLYTKDNPNYMEDLSKVGVAGGCGWQKKGFPFI